MYLAESYAKQQKLKPAIETSLTALQFCTSGQDDTRISLWENIRDWRFKLNDEAGAVEAAKEASSKQDNSWGTLINFECLYKLRQYQLIMDLAKALDKSTFPGSDESRLDEFLTECGFEASRLLGYVASSTGEIEYLDEVFQRLISRSRRDNDVLRERKHRATYACFVKTIQQDESKALKLLQDLTSEYLASPPATGFFLYNDEESRKASYALLIQLYLCKALRTTTSDSSVFAAELQTLLEKLNVLHAQPAEKEIYENQGSLAMGIWHRVQTQPEQAKACLRKLVLEYIEKISGNRNWYSELAEALLGFGDKENAVVAFSAAGVAPAALEGVQQPPDQVNTSEPNLRSGDAHADISKQNLPYNLPYRCAGKCNRKSRTWTAYFLCEYCYQTGFCEQCMKLVKGSQLGFLVCDSSHPLLQIYPLDKELAQVGASVGEDGQVKPREEWLELLRQEWT